MGMQARMGRGTLSDLVSHTLLPLMQGCLAGPTHYKIVQYLDSMRFASAWVVLPPLRMPRPHWQSPCGTTVPMHCWNLSTKCAWLRWGEGVRPVGSAGLRRPWRTTGGRLSWTADPPCPCIPEPFYWKGLASCLLHLLTTTGMNVNVSPSIASVRQSCLIYCGLRLAPL